MIRPRRPLPVVLIATVAVASAATGGCGTLLDYADTYDVAPSTGGAAGGGGPTAGAGQGGSVAGQAGSSAGRAGQAGNGGASAGQGGASAGQGGASAGQGGATAGQGGATAGQGGASAGQGGSSAGQGGATAGQGGASAGQGGASAGQGGATAGQGGASAGQGGASAGQGGASAGQGGATAGQGGSSAGQGGSAGQTGGGPTDCSVLYVSPAGLDTNDGCSPAKPLPTPASAIASVRANTSEIHLCKGSWDVSSLTLSVPVSLRGGYDCTSWQRGPLVLGAEVSVLSSTTDAPALRIMGPMITRATLVDGLALVGRSGGSKSRGVVLTTGASPTLTNNTITAGSANGADAPSLALHVMQGAAPRIEGNAIRGGKGTTSAITIASAAITIANDAGAVEIVGNTIVGGEARLSGKGVGSVGLVIEPLDVPLTGTASVRDNLITAGRGTDTAHVVDDLSIGVLLTKDAATKGNVAIVGGVVQAGLAEHLNGSGASVPRATGILSRSHATLLVDRCRVYAGDAVGGKGASTAVQVEGSGTATIRSSLLHAGGTLAPTSSRTAITTRQTGVLSVIGSTLLTGGTPSSDTETGAAAIYAYAPGKLTLTSNFFFLQAGYAEGIQLTGLCAPAAGSSLVANGFASVRAGHAVVQIGAGAPGDCFHREEAMTAAAAVFPTASANLRVTPFPKDATETTITCATEAACRTKIVSEFDEPSAGRSQAVALLDGALVPRGCLLGKGGLFVAEAPVDLLGVKRPEPKPTVGALQTAAGLCP